MNEKQEIHLVFEGFGISGNIFIANYAAACNISLLYQRKIGAIVSAGRGLFLNHSKEHIPSYLYLPIDDSPEQQLTQFFDVSFEFIDKNIARTNVLVHCYSGISRSAAIIAAYLIQKYSFSLKESIILLKNIKKRIKPNPSFLKQLLQLEKKIESGGTPIHQQYLPKDREKLEKANLDLASMKSQGQSIAEKINSARAKLEESQGRRRPASDYLRKCLEQRSQRSSISTVNDFAVDAREDRNTFDTQASCKRSGKEDIRFNARKTFG